MYAIYHLTPMSTRTHKRQHRMLHWWPEAILTVWFTFLLSHFLLITLPLFYTQMLDSMFIYLQYAHHINPWCIHATEVSSSLFFVLFVFCCFFLLVWHSVVTDTPKVASALDTQQYTTQQLILTLLIILFICFGHYQKPMHKYQRLSHFYFFYWKPIFRAWLHNFTKH